MTSAFVGAWRYNTGSIDQMCNIAGIPAVDLTSDAMTIVKADDTHIRADWAATEVMCSIEYTVAGTIATSVPGQTCTEMIPVTVGGTAMTIAMNIAITTSTLTLTGVEVTMALSGTATAEGGLVSCTPTGTGTATSSAGAAAGHGG
jgi:hypothetical protein